MLIYLAGKYSRGNIETNIEAARVIAVELWKKGYYVICPHLNTAYMEKDNLDYEVVLAGDFRMIDSCDALIMLPDWQESSGAVRERQYAESWGLPVFEYPNIPPLHPTESLRPKQAETFRHIINQMYRVHLDKNADYSPANILGAGEVGITVRIWDKVARLMNLCGFRIEIQSSQYAQPSNPKLESVTDTYMDLSVYGIIGLIYRQGHWGV